MFKALTRFGITYYVASSLDGFIAHEDGTWGGFLTEGEHFADLFASFPETLPDHLRDVLPDHLREALGVRGVSKRFDVVLMGRGTYEEGLKLGVTHPYPTMKQYLFSRTMTESPDAQVELVSENAVAVVGALKHEPGKDIWLCGGGLATTLFSEIDEMIVKLNPVLLGSGIPLFSGDVQQTDLELTDSKVYRNGFMLLHYRLKH